MQSTWRYFQIIGKNMYESSLILYSELSSQVTSGHTSPRQHDSAVSVGQKYFKNNAASPDEASISMEHTMYIYNMYIYIICIYIYNMYIYIYVYIYIFLQITQHIYIYSYIIQMCTWFLETCLISTCTMPMPGDLLWPIGQWLGQTEAYTTLDTDLFL